MQRFVNARVHLTMLLTALALVGCHSNRPPLPPLPETPEAGATPPAPPTCKFTAEPAAIEQGKSVTLSWSSENATDVKIDPDLGKQLTQGSTTASPENSATFILTATGPGGTATCTTRVTVGAPTGPSTPSVSEENINGAGAGGALSSQLKDIFFDYDSSDLRPDAEQTLTEDATLLKAHPGAGLAIQGNCDQRGSEEYNLGLGQRRASVARDYLVNLGVAASRLSTISYGKDRLTCTDNTDDCYKQNRRDHLELK